MKPIARVLTNMHSLYSRTRSARQRLPRSNDYEEEDRYAGMDLEHHIEGIDDRITLNDNV